MMTLQEAQALPKLRTFTSEWRQRVVTIYEHPTDPTRVITVGIPFSFISGSGEPIITDELRSAFWSELREVPPRF